MKLLKGRNLRLAITATRAGAWALVVALLCATALQVAASACALAGRRVEAAQGPSRDDPEAEAPAELLPIEHFASIWQRLDPPEPEPERAPASPAEPEEPGPAPDPYPALRLIGTIVEEGSSYALIQIRPGVTQMLREGQAHEDLRLVSVGETAAEVEVGGEPRTLRIEPEAPAP